MSGIRVALKLSGEACPVVQESIANGTSVREINKMSLTEDGSVVEEVVFDDDVESSNESFHELYSTEDVSIYQFSRSRSGNCACDHIEADIRHPVSTVRVKNGSLYISVHLEEIDQLQSIVETLEERFEQVTVCKIDHTAFNKSEDAMTFDRERLTPRQREVYRTAYEMGYFKHNQDANATEIADELGIAVSTFSEHMNILQDKLADAFFNNGDY
jgi:predicted DNA binding protein